MQLFVDAGLPVNEGLVNSLVRDVIRDRIKATLGSHRKPRRARFDLSSSSLKRGSPLPPQKSLDDTLNESKMGEVGVLNSNPKSFEFEILQTRSEKFFFSFWKL